MKYFFVTLGISLILFMSIQTYSIYGINGNETNTTESIASGDQLETNELGYVQAEAGVNGDSLNIGENASLYSNFFDMISEGKTTFLNVLNIKPNTIINPTALTCFKGEGGGYYSGSDMRQLIFIEEQDCDNVIVFEKNDTYGKDSIRSQHPVISSKILTALQEGIERPISACVIGTLEEGWVDLEGVNCEKLYIAYK
jgi:hypothetical protein